MTTLADGREVTRVVLWYEGDISHTDPAIKTAFLQGAFTVLKSRPDLAGIEIGLNAISAPDKATSGYVPTDRYAEFERVLGTAGFKIVPDFPGDRELHDKLFPPPQP